MRYTWENAPHSEKCAKLGKNRTLRKVSYTWKNASHLKKDATHGKKRHYRNSAAHLEKCATIAKKCRTLRNMRYIWKMGHTWKSASHLKKCAILEKMRQTCKKCAIPKKGCEEICICFVLAELLHFKLKRDLRKETDIKWVTKGNRKFPHTLF